MPPAFEMLDAAFKVLLESSKVPVLEQNTVGVFEISVRIHVGAVAVVSHFQTFFPCQDPRRGEELS